MQIINLVPSSKHKVMLYNLGLLLKYLRIPAQLKSAKPYTFHKDGLREEMVFIVWSAVISSKTATHVILVLNPWLSTIGYKLPSLPKDQCEGFV